MIIQFSNVIHKKDFEIFDSEDEKTPFLLCRRGTVSPRCQSIFDCIEFKPISPNLKIHISSSHQKALIKSTLSKYFNIELKVF